MYVVMFPVIWSAGATAAGREAAKGHETNSPPPGSGEGGARCLRGTPVMAGREAGRRGMRSGWASCFPGEPRPCLVGGDLPQDMPVRMPAVFRGLLPPHGQPGTRVGDGRQGEALVPHPGE